MTSKGLLRSGSSGFPSKKNSTAKCNLVQYLKYRVRIKNKVMVRRVNKQKLAKKQNTTNTLVWELGRTSCCSIIPSKQRVQSIFGMRMYIMSFGLFRVLLLVTGETLNTGGFLWKTLWAATWLSELMLAIQMGTSSQKTCMLHCGLHLAQFASNSLDLS